MQQQKSRAPLQKFKLQSFLQIQEPRYSAQRTQLHMRLSRRSGYQQLYQQVNQVPV